MGHPIDRTAFLPMTKIKSSVEKTPKNAGMCLTASLQNARSHEEE